jgi:hypothetical protein
MPCRTTSLSTRAMNDLGFQFIMFFHLFPLVNTLKFVRRGAAAQTEVALSRGVPTPLKFYP